MAVVKVFTQGVWSCPCRNLFGYSYWPMTEADQSRYRKQVGACTECSKTIALTGTNNAIVERPIDA